MEYYFHYRNEVYHLHQNVWNWRTLCGRKWHRKTKTTGSSHVGAKMLKTQKQAQKERKHLCVSALLQIWCVVTFCLKSIELLRTIYYCSLNDFVTILEFTKSEVEHLRICLFLESLPIFLFICWILLRGTLNLWL